MATIQAMHDKKERDALKATLPAITPSGLFTRREASALIQHSGLICLDIDLKGNQTISNYADLKKQFARIENVAYCGLSVSGTGFFLLIPIAYPQQHESQFKDLRQLFKNRFGVKIDSTPDVARLRGYSFDAEGFFNHHATPFTGLYKEPVKTYVAKDNFAATGDTAQRVEELVKLVEHYQIDITSDYNDWLRIGFALANEFGELGRDFMHRISRFHPRYDANITDRKFDNCLKSDAHRTSIGTLFHICKDYGLELPKREPAYQPLQPVVIRSFSEWQPSQRVTFDESRVERL